LEIRLFQSQFVSLPPELDKEVLSFLDNHSLAVSCRVAKTWHKADAMQSLMTERKRTSLRYIWFSIQRHALLALNNLQTMLKTRKAVANCMSVCLWPVTIPATCCVGCLVIPCAPSLSLAIWNWWDCTAENGMEGPEAGTSCPVLNPWTPCATHNSTGLRYTCLRAPEEQRMALLERSVANSRV